MQTTEQRLRYEQLELVRDQSRGIVSIVKQGRSLLTQLGIQAIRALAPSHEPRIWTRTNGSGDQIWYVRDNHTRQVTRFSSESEVRVWLDKTRYLP